MTLRLVRPLCAMASAKSDGLDRLGKISELVGDHDIRIAQGGNQASEETLCGFGVAAGLNENVENGAVGNEVGNVMTPGFPSRGSGSTWQSPCTNVRRSAFGQKYFKAQVFRDKRNGPG